MSGRGILAGCALLLLPALSAAGAEKIVVAHFGDSTVICSYLKPEQRVNALLQKRLRARYPKQRIENVNVAQGGEFIRRFLDGGLGLDKEKQAPRYARKVKPRLKQLDIALIRYGQNDWKLEQHKEIAPQGYGTEAFKKDLARLVATLRKDYPGVHVVLETGTYFGGNGWTDKLSKRYWDAVRAVAQTQRLPLVDQHQRWAREVKAGTPVKKLRKGGHPTVRGVEVQADEEFRILTKLWPARLPRAGEQPAKKIKGAMPRVLPQGPSGKEPMTLIVDNADAAFETLVSYSSPDVWQASTRDSGYEGKNYLWARGRKGDGREMARWKLAIPEDGKYRVFAKWVASKPDDRATNAPYIVMHREGQTIVRVNMADLKAAGKWNELGVFNFAAGRKAQVLLTTHADNSVVADAVKLVRLGQADPEAKISEAFAKRCAARGKVVFADDFSGGLQNWVLEGAASVRLHGGRLRVETTPMPGHMAWIRKKMPAAFRLEFDVTPLTPSGFWLVFFCATAPGHAGIFDPKLPAREGIFERYVRNDGFACYHISYRRNRSATCNLRKNPHMKLLRQEKLDAVMPQGKTFHVALSYRAGHIVLKVEDQTFVDFTDKDHPYGSGYIALRNIYACRTEYDNVVVYDLTE